VNPNSTAIYLTITTALLAQSAGHHYTIKRRKLPEDFPLEQFVSGFIAGEYYSVFAGWQDHATSWLCTREGRTTFLLLRYEDILADPRAEVTKCGKPELR